MVSHICLLVELGPICNSMAASLCLKSCEDHSLLESYNGGLLENIYRSGPYCRVTVSGSYCRVTVSGSYCRVTVSGSYCRVTVSACISSSR